MPEISKANRVMSDNWSLQVVAAALSDNLDLGDFSLLEVDKDSNSHGYRDVPGGAVAIEAIFDLISDVVFREQILVDEKFLNAWRGMNSSVDQLVDEKVLAPVPFLNQPQVLDEPRRFFVSKLCITDSLKQAQQENEEGWNKRRSTPDPLLSQIVWGGAGMLARAFVHELAYTPFPIRRRLMMDAGIAWLSEKEDAVRNFRELISEKQAQARMSVFESKEARLAQLRMNGAEIAALVIRESSSPQDLLKVAMQLRNDFAKLRQWLSKYQQALDIGDSSTIKKHEELLRSVSGFVDARLGKSNKPGPTFTIGWGAIQFSLAINPLDHMRNRLGVRAQINRLMFERTSKQDLSKLLDLFGQRKSEVGLEIAEYFSTPKGSAL